MKPTIANTENAENFNKFLSVLTQKYKVLFTRPDYSMAAARHTAESLASRMTSGIISNASDWTGTGVRQTFQELGLKHTRKAILAYIACADRVAGP